MFYSCFEQPTKHEYMEKLQAEVQRFESSVTVLQSKKEQAVLVFAGSSLT